MLVEDFLDKIAQVTERLEKATDIYVEKISSYKNDRKDKPLEELSNKLLTTEGYTKQLEQKKENLNSINMKTQELTNKIKELEGTAADLKRKITELEVELQKLGSNTELSALNDKLNPLKTIKKCADTIFPVVFDFSDKNVSGYMFKKETGEYHGFELPPGDSAANTKHAWKHLNKLFPE